MTRPVQVILPLKSIPRGGKLPSAPFPAYMALASLLGAWTSFPLKKTQNRKRGQSLMSTVSTTLFPIIYFLLNSDYT